MSVAPALNRKVVHQTHVGRIVHGRLLLADSSDSVGFGVVWRNCNKTDQEQAQKLYQFSG